MSRSYAVGLDLGGTDIKAALIGDDARIVVKASRPTGATRDAQTVLADMADAADQVIAKGKVDRTSVIGLGIGAPGPLSPRRGIIFKAANLPTFENVPIRDELARRTGMSAVFDNDGNAATYGEFWAGAGRNVQYMVMLTLGTGVGAGIILGGRLLHGHFENAAELGHWIVEPGGRSCPCGQRGCLEQYASAESVARRMREELGPIADHPLAGSPEKIAAITSRDVVEAARARDGLAMRIWDDACRYLAIACINVQHCFNPEMIVLGGGMSAAGDILIEGVHRHLREQVWSLADDLPQVVLAELGNDAGVMGAAGLAFQACNNGWESG
ncbi:MAG TPA: ROK family glucokinase [Phycisphaerae bacterium]|nr:ROK family glucokinase [Phycisphaerae bacterium]